MKINKKIFIRSMLLAFLCLYGARAFAQEGSCCQEEDWIDFECFTVYEEPGIVPMAANCSYNGITDNEDLFRPYIPTENSEIITVRLNLHSMQKSDGSGNFKNNIQDIAFLHKLIEDLNNYLANFKEPVYNGLTGDPYIKDSRIRCVVDGIYFHQIDDFYHQKYAYKDNVARNCFQQCGKGKDYSLNIFILEMLKDNGSLYTDIGGSGFGLNGETQNYMALYSYYQYYLSNSYYGTLISNFAHELGHAFGLMHTFQSGINNDYLSDTYYPEKGNWCSPTTDSICSNNLMSYSNTKNHLSPLQAGKMHKLLTVGWRAKMNDNSKDNAATKNLYTSDTWNIPRCFKGGIAIRGSGTNITTIDASCHIYLPANKNVEIYSQGKLVLNDGHVKNNFGEITGIVVYAGGCLEINSSTLDNCIVTVKNGGTLIINGTLNVINQGKIQVESGGYVCVKSTARLVLTDEWNIMQLYDDVVMGAHPRYMDNTSGCLPVASWNVSGNGSVKQPGDLYMVPPYPIRMDYSGLTDWGINVADVTGDGRQEIFFANRADYVTALDYDGKELFNLDGNPNTYSGFAKFPGDVAGIPAIGDLYGNGKMYLVQPMRELGSSLNGLYCYSFEDNNKDGAPDLHWLKPKGTETSYRGAVLANVDNSADGSLEIIVGYENGKIEIYSANSTLLATMQGGGSTYGAIAVADLDGDGDMEIIQASGYGIYIWHHDGRNFGSTQPVFNISGSGYRMRSSVVVCDIDNDGKKEIITAALKENTTAPEGKIYVIRPDGVSLNNWGKSSQTIPMVNDWHTLEVVVGDLDGDGTLEVVAMGKETVKVWDNEGNLLSTIRVSALTNNMYTPVLADVDGGKDAEIIFVAGGHVYAYKMDGSPAAGFPAPVVISGPVVPCVADIDGDGKNELILSTRTTVHVWKTDGKPENIEWGRERHNQHNTGEYTRTKSAASPVSPYPFKMDYSGLTDWGVNVADVNNDGKQEIFFSTRGSNIAALDYKGQELFDIDNNPDTYAGFANFSTIVMGIPVIGDLYNNGKKYLVAVTNSSGSTQNEIRCYSFEDTNRDGKPDLAWSVNIGTQVSNRGVVLANVDNSVDGSLEIVVGYYSGRVEVYSASGQLKATMQGGGTTYGHIAVADLDGDGDMEIIQASGYGVYIWHHDGRNFISSRQPVLNISGSGYRMRSSVTICDIDNDGRKEIITGALKENTTTPEGKIYVARPDGTLVSGWGGSGQTIPMINDWMTLEVSVGDLNHDGNLEVVALGKQVLKVWNNQGKLLTSVNIPELTAHYTIAPVLADVDWDSDVEIIFNVGDKNLLYAYKMDGSPVSGFPLQLEIASLGVPCVADIDGDGKNELLLATRSYIHMWKTEGKPENIEWGRERQNQHNTGEYIRTHNARQMPNFPVFMDYGGITDWGITTADVKGDGTQVAFFASRYGHLAAVDHNGKELFDIDNNPDTYAGFASFVSTASGLPAIGELRGNGRLYVVQPTWEIERNPKDNAVYCFSFEDADRDGKPDTFWRTAPDQNWASYRGAVLANIDNSADGSMEVVVGYDSGLIAIYSATGTLLRTIPGGGSTYGAIAVADLDGDGDMEIIQATAYGVYIWHHDGRNFGSTQPVYSITGSGYHLKSSVVICDLDNDGIKEILVAAIKEGVTPSEARIHAIKPNGQLLSGWGGSGQSVVKQDNWHSNEIAVGDLDGDGKLEVVVAGLNTVKVWNNKGQLISSTTIDGVISRKAPVVLADVDGGNDVEVIFCATSGHIHAVKMDGSPVAGFPITTPERGGVAPCVADIDGDGRNEILVITSSSTHTRINAWKTSGSSDLIEWSRERHNQHNTGEYFRPGTFPYTISVVNESGLRNRQEETGIFLPEESRIHILHSSEGITIESYPERMSAIYMLDISGKQLVKESNLNTYYYLLPKTSSGVYILTVQLESGKQITRKVVF